MKRIVLLFVISIIFFACRKKSDFYLIESSSIKSAEHYSIADTSLPFIIANDAGIVSFINANNGNVIGDRVSAKRLTQTPLAVNGNLIAFAGRYVVATDTAAHKIIWKTIIDTQSDFSFHSFTSYPCLSNHHIFFIYSHNTPYTLFSIDEVTGEVEWSHPLPRTYMNDGYLNGGHSGPACNNNTVIAASNDTLYA